ncbi:hypothetical protein CDG61_15945 [Acinetobacter sp. WCHAc010052]|jgi:hypothetical protein|nr:hypothetical protein [Acinetobacter sp. WCHAc010052]AXY61368.1 hypothetical protein CDG61_15945 [Acinetobacter sp. WCHAc010052]
MYKKDTLSATRLGLLIMLGMVSMTVLAEEDHSASEYPVLPQTVEQISEFTQKYNLLYQIPRWIDSTPTFLPEQSDNPIVPPVSVTENSTWIDQKQLGIRNWADRTAVRIDNWFGETDPKKPATASLRVLVDNSWNEYDGYEIKPRIRGRIKLPTLEKKLSLVFGDDSLDNELNTNVAITNENPVNSPDKKLDTKRTRDSNSSLALRWSQFSEKIPFKTDADLGVRSGDDIYVRLKASREWQLDNDFKFYAEQIYRYGIDSENYLRTNLELTHARPNQAFFSNQLNLTYADTQYDDLTWDNFTFRQHQFFQNNRFNYGIYTGGFYTDENLRLNSWGPFVSWRQPFLREWFYVQGDLNYLNDHRADRNHFVGASIRLETLF